MTEEKTAEKTFGSARTELNGRDYLTNAKGALMPVEKILPLDLLLDEAVHKIMHYAGSLSARLTRFKGYTMQEIVSLQALVAQEYNCKIGGAKGNLTLTSYDGCRRVKLQIQDQIDFGPELQVAKELVDQCLLAWSADGNDNIRAIITRAFQIDQQGKINRNDLFMLMRVDIPDENWKLAMKALQESIRIIGSKSYLRLETRDTPDGPWRAITIDLASA